MFDAFRGNIGNLPGGKFLAGIAAAAVLAVNRIVVVVVVVVVVVIVVVVVVVAVVVVVGVYVVVVVVVVAATSAQAAAQLRDLEQARGATAVLEVPPGPFRTVTSLCHLRAMSLSLLLQVPF